MTRWKYSDNNVSYTVPKLKSYTAAALDKAVEKLLAALAAESKAVENEGDWKVFRDRWMARKNGVLTQINDLWLKAAPGKAKPVVGQKVNWLKKHVEGMVEVAKNQLLLQQAPADEVGIVVDISPHDLGTLSRQFQEAKLRSQSVDIALPGIRRPLGAEHPVIKTVPEIVSVFRNLGYSVQ